MRIYKNFIRIEKFNLDFDNFAISKIDLKLLISDRNRFAQVEFKYITITIGYSGYC